MKRKNSLTCFYFFLKNSRQNKIIKFFKEIPCCGSQREILRERMNQKEIPKLGAGVAMMLKMIMILYNDDVVAGDNNDDDYNVCLFFFVFEVLFL